MRPQQQKPEGATRKRVTESYAVTKHCEETMGIKLADKRSFTDSPVMIG